MKHEPITLEPVNLNVIDADKLEVARRIPTLADPEYLDVEPGGKRVFIANDDGRSRHRLRRDENRAEIRGDADAARSRANRYRLDRLVVRVEHGDGVVLLVADEELTPRRPCRRKRRAAARREGRRLYAYYKPLLGGRVPQSPDATLPRSLVRRRSRQAAQVHSSRPCCWPRARYQAPSCRVYSSSPGCAPLESSSPIIGALLCPAATMSGVTPAADLRVRRRRRCRSDPSRCRPASGRWRDGWCAPAG